MTAPIILNDVPDGYDAECYVVATDTFLSGWGQTPGRSLYVVAVRNNEEMMDVAWRMRQHSDFSRVRFNRNLPRLHAGDHMHVVPFERFRYQPAASGGDQ